MVTFFGCDASLFFHATKHHLNLVVRIDSISGQQQSILSLGLDVVLPEVFEQWFQ